MTMCIIWQGGCWGCNIHHIKYAITISTKKLKLKNKLKFASKQWDNVRLCRIGYWAMLEQQGIHLGLGLQTLLTKYVNYNHICIKYLITWNLKNLNFGLIALEVDDNMRQIF